jgi:rod shape-determining protein MreD
MWPVFTIILFYFFALLQNSFFVYFNFFGAVPNFLFVLFFIYIFFSKKEDYLKTILIAILAGFFLDILSVNKIGVSVVFLIIISLIIKKIKSLLKDQEDNYPFGHFVVLFLISFILYYFSLEAFFYLTAKYVFVSIDFKLLFEILYSLFFAIIGYFVGKKFVKKNV